MKEVIADGIEVYLGDCGEILPTLGLVDAVVTDPPYGIGENNKRNLSRARGGRAIDYGECDWDKEPASEELILLLREVSRHQIIFGGNFFHLPPSSCWLVWDKMNSGDFADCELAWTNLPKAVRRLQWLWNGMIRKGNDVREHLTQKPVGVMVWAIDQLPRDAKLICDPFMGSGTTGIAAIRLNRQFIGIEREQRYYDIACRRISDALAQPNLLFDAPVFPCEAPFLFESSS